MLDHTGTQVEKTQVAAVPVAVRPKRSLAERGMATVEYAIGVLAAAAVALVLLRIFNDNSFFQTLFDWVVGLLKKIPLPAR